VFVVVGGEAAVVVSTAESSYWKVVSKQEVKMMT
jgi:hypothetical protein